MFYFRISESRDKNAERPSCRTQIKINDGYTSRANHCTPKFQYTCRVFQMQFRGTSLLGAGKQEAGQPTYRIG